MSRFPDGDPAIKRIARWQPSLSVALTATQYAWVTLTLTLPETVDWNKTILRIDGHGFGLQMGAGAVYGVIWKPGADGNSATIYVKAGSTGTKTWTPQCELWILDDEYAAYHLYGNWDTTEAAANWYAQTATCGDANAAARAVMWLVNMDYPAGSNGSSGACICNDNAYLGYAYWPYRDANNNSCLYYYDTYANSNIFYSFTYVYKK